MRKVFTVITIAVVFLLICWSQSCEAFNGEDPWVKLRQNFPEASCPPLPLPDEGPENMAGKDPWQRLQQVIIPFSIKAESNIVADGENVIRGQIKKKLSPWRQNIDKAAAIFQIPVSIIEAVIMVESGGNAQAQASTSSAAGLMQTIKATFSEARQALTEQGVIIPDDPFNPYASIMAGSWYLNKMFEQAQTDAKPGVIKRSDRASWRYPLEYYYAGPGHGRKVEPRVLIYSGGKRLLIDKPAYSQKVLSWAAKLS
jgi:hypothetical protein